MNKVTQFSVVLPWLMGASALAMANPKVAVKPNWFAQESAAIENATRVYYPNQTMASQLSISYHQQLLMTNKDDGYMVIQLSDRDKSQLHELGFKLKPANQWIKQRRLQLQQLQHKAHHSNQDDNSIDGFACYSTVEGTYAQAEQLAQQYPQLAQWVDIGDSWAKTENVEQGYDIKVMQITNAATNSERVDKPILFIHSAMHAREYATAELTLRFAQQLLTEYGNDADISWILDHHQVHIVFHMNPDGRKRAETGLLWRKNVNTQYCWEDSGSSGVDLNRNFSHFWNATPSGSSGSECSQVFRGPTAASEPETQVIENYIRSIFADRRGPLDTDAAPLDTTGIHIDVHSYSELVLWPWGHTSAGAPNETGLRALGRKLAYFNGYTPQQSVGLYPTDGTSDDVSYGELGVAAFTFELGTHFFQDCNTFENTIVPDNLESLLYAAKVVRAPYLIPSGPDATEVRFNGKQALIVAAGDEVSLTATINDKRYQTLLGQEPTQNIIAAEYYVDQLPWQEGAVAYPLTAVDGLFNNRIEAVHGLVNTEDLAIGRYAIYVRGQDANEQWGAISGFYLNIVDEADLPTNSAPVAAFVAQCSGLNCQFDGSGSTDSDDQVVNYRWELGDGHLIEGAQQFQFDHRYQSAQAYDVTLTVTDSHGASHQTSHTLNVENLAPVASFIVTCTQGNCQFDATTSSDADGEIDSRQWLVNDQLLESTAAVVDYHFATSGDHQVIHQVTDDQGASHSVSQTVSVAVVEPQPDPQPDPQPSNSGSGGGSFGWLTLLAGLALRLKAKNRAIS